jgi:hypothetical protein
MAGQYTKRLSSRLQLPYKSGQGYGWQLVDLPDSIERPLMPHL